MEKRTRKSLSLTKKLNNSAVKVENEVKIENIKNDVDCEKIELSNLCANNEIVVLSSASECEDQLGNKEDIKKQFKKEKQKKNSKKIKVTRKDAKQPTLRNFFSSSGSNSYFRTHKESSFPTIIGNEELNMSSFLHVSLKEEEKSLSESQIQPEVEPQCITDQIQFDSGKDLNQQLDVLLYNQNTDPEKEKWNMEDNLIAVETQQASDNETAEDPGDKSDDVIIGNKKKKKVVVPKYKIVEGSTFAVDAFRYGDISNVTHYFLTHYHADHYIGLTKKFAHPIYLSKITAFLVLDLIGVDGKWLNVVTVNEAFFINDTRIIPIDANHCPGAVLFLFQFSNGRQMLHTGDYRANSQMVDLLNYWGVQLDVLYLDTTYLHTKRCFPSQQESIEFLIEHTKKFLYDNIGEKYVILCGSYLVGKEKVWKALAETFNFKVWLEKERRKAFESICMASPEYLKDINLIVDDETDADIHVVHMNKLTYPNLKDFLRENCDNYTTLLAVIPSGWENQKYSSGKISMLHVQYSEHSSYDELEEFVRATKPKVIISTVPIGGNQSKTSNIPKEWLQESISVRTKFNQTSLINVKGKKEETNLG